MIPDEKQDEGLPFRSDFAVRVLDAADAISARRSKMRVAAVVSSAVVVAFLVTFGMWRMSSIPSSGVGRIPKQVAGIDLGDMSTVRSAQMGPLDYMFPDAAPLARFSDQYGGGEDALEDDAVFFPDATDDAAEEVDGS